MYLLHLLAPGVGMGGGGVVATLPCPYIPERTETDASVPASLVESASQDSQSWQVEFTSEYASVAEFSDYGAMALVSDQAYAAAVSVDEYVPASVQADSARNASIVQANDVHSVISAASDSLSNVEEVNGSLASVVTVDSEYTPARGGSCCCD